ncbi:hypothetical protein SAMN04515695_3620 [Pseudovibrio sp. Tun.PSC04-5.I4]|nr:hypothetical protein SAMN04515695_3620 [Pseudovibrio sp. Tun.PSC04-5.I4]
MPLEAEHRWTASIFQENTLCAAHCFTGCGNIKAICHYCGSRKLLQHFVFAGILNPKTGPIFWETALGFFSITWNNDAGDFTVLIVFFIEENVSIIACDVIGIFIELWDIVFT